MNVDTEFAKSHILDELDNLTENEQYEVLSFVLQHMGMTSAACLVANHQNFNFSDYLVLDGHTETLMSLSDVSEVMTFVLGDMYDKVNNGGIWKIQDCQNENNEVFIEDIDACKDEIYVSFVLEDV